MINSLTRRSFLSSALQQGPVLAVGASLMRLSILSHAQGFRVSGPLQAADANGICLPKGYQSGVLGILPPNVTFAPTGPALPAL